MILFWFSAPFNASISNSLLLGYIESLLTFLGPFTFCHLVVTLKKKCRKRTWRRLYDKEKFSNIFQNRTVRQSLWQLNEKRYAKQNSTRMESSSTAVKGLKLGFLTNLETFDRFGNIIKYKSNLSVVQGSFLVIQNLLAYQI